MAENSTKNNYLIKSIVFLVIGAIIALASIYFFKIQQDLYKKQKNLSQELFILQQQIQNLKSNSQKSFNIVQKKAQELNNQIANLPTSLNVSKEDLTQLANLANSAKEQVGFMANITLLNSLYNMQKAGNEGKDFNEEYNAFSNYLNIVYPNNIEFSAYMQQLQPYINCHIATRYELLKLLNTDINSIEPKFYSNWQNMLKNWIKSQIKIEKNNKKSQQISETNIQTQIKNFILSNNYTQAIFALQSSPEVNTVKGKLIMQKLNQKAKFNALVKQIRINLYNHKNGK